MNHREKNPLGEKTEAYKYIGKSTIIKTIEVMNHKELIRTLTACASACNHCADACLEEEHVKKMVTCIRLDRECAAICEAAAKVLSGTSQFSADLLALCEKVCTACAKECEQHEHQHCQECAAACWACAEACSSVAA